MSSPASAASGSTAKTTPMKYHSGIASFKPTLPLRQMPAASSGILTSSKTWSNATYQEDKQRQRQAQLAMHKRSKSQQQMGKQVIEKRKLQLDAALTEFPASPFLPITLNQRLDDEKALASVKQARLVRKRQEIESTMAAQKLAKESYGYNLGKPFGGKLRRGLFGAVLNKPTIWRAHNQTQIDLTLVEWPSPAEFSYEGREREASRQNFGPRLPIVRNWTEEFEPQHIDMSRHSLEEKDVRPWERFMALQPYEFDGLHDHKAPLHEELFPFGEGCIVPDCDVCRSHRVAFGLTDSHTYQAAVEQYKGDMSTAQLKGCVTKSLLAALDEPDC